jgi:hypothetical protein
MRTQPRGARPRAVATAALAAFCASASAFTFETESVRGNFDSTISAGIAVRAKNPSCSLVGDPSFCAEADVFGWANGDDGNLNYRKGDLFSSYLKGNHELLLNFRDDWKFLGRASWLYDFKADDTARTPLASDAKDQIVQDVRLLDFWLGKSLDIGGQRANLRLGNQFINWGESLFLTGGINATNAIDIQRLLQPGTQLKEAFLPSPMISASSGLGRGVSVEGYYQFRWTRTKFPPVGGYWSVVDLYDKGRQPIFLGPDPAAAAALGIPESPSIPLVADAKPSNQGQWGLSAHWQPDGTDINFGLYALNYHDKTPNLRFVADGGQWVFLEDRKLYGASVNFPLGNWAIGSELSYRPRDAIALSSCFLPGMTGDNIAGVFPGPCEQYIDSKRWQWHLTGLLSFTPGDHGAFLNLLRAQTATLLAEAVVIHYPGLKSLYRRNAPDGTPIEQLPAAGLWGWSNDGGATVFGAGSKTSSGINFDFSWVYDGSLIEGWQVVPEIYYFHALSGRTPNLAANFMKGARSANFILSFIRNPAKWQFTMNYAIFRGGKASFDQPYGDRDFFGAVLSRNF